MLVAAVLCLCAAALTAALGAWSLMRRPSTEYVQQVLRAVAPTQLAAAVMLAAGAVVALSATAPMSVVILVVCVAGATGTVAAGCWQAAQAVSRRNDRQAATAGGCGGSGDGGSGCGTCTLSCDR